MPGFGDIEVVTGQFDIKKGIIKAKLTQTTFKVFFLIDNHNILACLLSTTTDSILMKRMSWSCRGIVIKHDFTFFCAQ